MTAAFSETRRPFPQHTRYAAGAILPAHRGAELDEAVRAFYGKWRGKYLQQAPGKSDQLFVNYNLEGKAHKGADPRSTSEGHGYGMLATVLMAEAANDATAHAEFDGLYRYFRAHPSETSPDLMAWLQAGRGGEMKNVEGDDSASDGDQDIAYALLLADAQWGSASGIDYLAEARKVIAAIKAHEVNQEKWTIMLGDFAQGDKKFGTAMRTSDFMTQQWKSFAEKTGDADWEKARASTYDLLGKLFAGYAPQTGLMPDFVMLKSGAYQPPRGKFLEDKHDGDWYYNACRTPWRLAADYLINGDTRALPQLRALNAWIQRQTGGDPHQINAGYTLAGLPIGGRIVAGKVENGDDDGSCFYAPLAVSAMVDGQNQAWLDGIWKYLQERDPDKDDDYFSNSVKLMCMIVGSGNWWGP